MAQSKQTVKGSYGGVRDTDTEKRPPIKRKPRKRRGRKKKKKTFEDIINNIDLPRILRLLFFSIIIGLIVYHYYLSTEGRMLDTYKNFWNNNKKIMLPGFIITLYTLIVLYIGIWIGKKR